MIKRPLRFLATAGDCVLKGCGYSELRSWKIATTFGTYARRSVVVHSNEWNHKPCLLIMTIALLVSPSNQSILLR